MFINYNGKRSRRWNTQYGEQRASGSFLMVFCNEKHELRALVRHVRMHQCGHFMMASVTINSPMAKSENDTISAFDKRRSPTWYRVGDGHYKVSLSGSYGGDGLPITESHYPGLWDQLHPVPEDLTKLFWAGGGHNGSGAEGPEMHRWASENVQTLRRLRKEK